MASDHWKLFVRALVIGLLVALVLTWTFLNKPVNVLNISSTFFNLFQAGFKPEQRDCNVCGDVLIGMMQGRWRPRNVTSKERMEAQLIYMDARRRSGLPRNLQRADGMCGNVSLQDRNKWTRALCDVTGDKPCCFQNKCVNRTREQCTCAQCFDLRQSVNAELATWTTENTSCQPQPMSVEAMCRALSGFQLYFIGDSLVRHVYTALLMLVRGDEITGALRNRAPPAKREACSGMFMFTWTECRDWLDTDVALCNGSVRLHFLMYADVSKTNAIDKLLFGRNHTAGSLVFLGMGIWNSLNSTKIWNTLLSPLLRKRARLNVTNPRLVWLSTHCPGLMKNGWAVQDKENVRKFNDVISKFLK